MGVGGVETAGECHGCPRARSSPGLAGGEARVQLGKGQLLTGGFIYPTAEGHLLSVDRPPTAIFLLSLPLLSPSLLETTLLPSAFFFFFLL